MAVPSLPSIAAVQEFMREIAPHEVGKMPTAEAAVLGRTIQERMEGSVAGAAGSVSDVPVPLETPPSGPGLSPSKPSSPGPPRFNYILGRPLRVGVKLGFAAKFLHYFGETAFHFINAGLIYYATDNPVPALTVLAVGLPRVPAMIAAQSMADLGIRFLWHKHRALRRLAKIPGVRKIQMLTSSSTRFEGVLARSRDYRGIVFIETSKPLEDNDDNPVLLEAPEEMRLRLTLEIDGQPSAVSWIPTVQELLEKKPIPVEIADSWRAEISEFQKGQGWFQRLFGTAELKKLKVHATLIGQGGSEKPIGAIAEGGAAKGLVGLTLRQRAADWLRRFFLRRPRAERPIPVAEKRVPER